MNAGGSELFWGFNKMNRFKESTEKLFGEMRDLTPEESKSVSNYISSISKSTGVNIFDLMNIPPSCRNCYNHPTNGGGGICHCILGLLKVTY